MDTEVIRQYKAAKEAEQELADRLDAAKKIRAALEEQVIEQLIETGVQSLNLDGATVYLRRDVYPSYPAGKDAAIALLEQDPRYTDVVQRTVNHNTVCALLRERAGEYPAEWQGILEASDVYRVGLKQS